jgi:predicted DNA binding protein
MKIIFSVSPIRHWKDGAHENNVSKSTLLLAIDELQKQFKRVEYFPAYEIQMDELRDYRFYASDMLHPSDVAVDYIWSRFSETYFDERTTRMKKEFEQLAADLSHRPLHPDSEEYKAFLKNTETRKAKLISEFPFISDRIK